MKRIHALAALATLALGAGAFAGPVTYDFSSTESLHGRASFTGSAVYDNTNDTLTFDITNTSKGALTAFAFEAPKGDAAKFVRPAGSSFKDDRNKKDIVNAAPYGKYEGGAAVNGKWGSTAAKKGLAAGQSETFVFDVTGSNASSLTTADFFNDTKAEVVAHFAGFKGHKQDKAGRIWPRCHQHHYHDHAGRYIGLHSESPGCDQPAGQHDRAAGQWRQWRRGGSSSSGNAPPASRCARGPGRRRRIQTTSRGLRRGHD